MDLLLFIYIRVYFNLFILFGKMGERGGLVVESRILEHEVRGSILTKGIRL